MSETKSVHDLTTWGKDPSKKLFDEKLIAEIRENQRKLSTCIWHDFSICLDRLTRQPIENPTDVQKFGARWRCANCGGAVGSQEKSWYELGRSHLPNWVHAAAKTERNSNQSPA